MKVFIKTEFIENFLLFPVLIHLFSNSFHTIDLLIFVTHVLNFDYHPKIEKYTFEESAKYFLAFIRS